MHRRSVSVVLAVLFGLLGACGGGGGSGRGDSPRETRPAPAARKIAFLRAVRSSQPENQAAFLDELAGAGYTEGDNLELFAGSLDEVHADEASATAAVRQWVAADVDLIIALSTVGARAAAAAAPQTKVLFLVNDPVSVGLVDDLRRPSGNLTGATFKVPADRTLDVARRALPGVTKIGAVYPPEDPAALALAEEAESAAATLGVGLVTATFTNGEDVGAAIEAVRSQGAGAVWVLNSPTSIRHIVPLSAAAAAARLPIVSNTTVATAAITLQPDTIELYRQIARQALELFDGVPVSEVPVENPAKFVLEVNIPAAAAVGVTLPEDFVEDADRVTR